MLRIDAEAIAQYLHDLWPQWAPPEALAAWWINELAKLPDENRTRQAINKHRAESRSKEPYFKNIVMHLDELTPRKHDDTHGPKATGVYIQCRADDKHPAHVGGFVPIVFPGGRDVPPYVVQDVAQAEAEARQRCYGGEWVVVQGATDADMILASDELRKALPVKPRFVRPGDRSHTVTAAIADYMAEHKAPEAMPKDFPDFT